MSHVWISGLLTIEDLYISFVESINGDQIELLFSYISTCLVNNWHTVSLVYSI